MAVQKLSISLDKRVAEDVKRAAAEAGISLSAWLSEMAEERIKIQDGLRAVREWEAEHGPITEKERAEADEVLRRHGVI